jgi:hypothetical protein
MPNNGKSATKKSRSHCSPGTSSGSESASPSGTNNKDKTASPPPGRLNKQRIPPKGSSRTSSQSSEPSKRNTRYSAGGEPILDGRKSNLKNSGLLSTKREPTIRAVTPNANRRYVLSSKLTETTARFEAQFLSNSKAYLLGSLTYVHLWRRFGKARADNYARQFGIPMVPDD